MMTWDQSIASCLVNLASHHNSLTYQTPSPTVSKPAIQSNATEAHAGSLIPTLTRIYKESSAVSSQHYPSFLGTPYMQS